MELFRVKSLTSGAFEAFTFAPVKTSPLCLSLVTVSHKGTVAGILRTPCTVIFQIPWVFKSQNSPAYRLFASSFCNPSSLPAKARWFVFYIFHKQVGLSLPEQPLTFQLTPSPASPCPKASHGCPLSYTVARCLRMPWAVVAPSFQGPPGTTSPSGGSL
jgi:hypothetical protein